MMPDVYPVSGCQQHGEPPGLGATQLPFRRQPEAAAARGGRATGRAGGAGGAVEEPGPQLGRLAKMGRYFTEFTGLVTRVSNG